MLIKDSPTSKQFIQEIDLSRKVDTERLYPPKIIHLTDVAQLQQKQVVDNFFKKLKELGYKHFERLISEHAITANSLRPFSRWSKEKYQRVCLAKDEHCELILLCWVKGQGTPVHDHNGQNCWVYVLEGRLKEIFYQKHCGKTIVSEQVLTKGGMTAIIHDSICHRLVNIADNVSMSLHLYANPIRECRIYNEEKEQFVAKKLKYDYLIAA